MRKTCNDHYYKFFIFLSRFLYQKWSKNLLNLSIQCWTRSLWHYNFQWMNISVFIFYFFLLLSHIRSQTLFIHKINVNSVFISLFCSRNCVSFLYHLYLRWAYILICQINIFCLITHMYCYYYCRFNVHIQTFDSNQTI